WLLWGFSKVTRRKGGTISRRYLTNGYVHNHHQQHASYIHSQKRYWYIPDHSPINPPPKQAVLE
ncbi:hypothetical protein NUV89_23080, partial [Pseudomonas sp. 18.1.10]|uniref:hypothetical protein n=1 Tax=Pseudomonas sp. 18.1.10 TaxID=2969302 RepID=UPI00215040D7